MEYQSDPVVFLHFQGCLPCSLVAAATDPIIGLLRALNHGTGLLQNLDSVVCFSPALA